MINEIKGFIDDNRQDIYYIFILVALLLVISIPKLLIQYNIGIANWDTYLYLDNGRLYAKMGWGDVPSISPVLPLILAKIFLITGHTYPEAIFNVDVFFYILGTIALYLLFRYKFSPNTSLLGSMIYATFTLSYSWVAIGGNDIIGVSGTILTIYLILIANKYSNKFYLLALPIAAYAFLSRYTAGVMIFSILFYLIINRVKIKEIFHIIIGGILGVISISWFLFEFNKALNTPFPFLGQFSGTVQNTPVLDSGYVPDNMYFIRNIPQYLSSYVNTGDFNSLVNPSINDASIFSYILIILMVIGFVAVFYKIAKAIYKNREDFKKRRNLALLIFLIVVGISCVLSIDISYIITVLTFLIVLGGVYYLVEDYDIEKLDYEFLMISLFVVYLVFQSILSTKNDRYFITVLPFIAYFITCGLSWIYDEVDGRFKEVSLRQHHIKISSVISAALIAFLIVSSLIFCCNIPEDNHYKDIEEACDWLVLYDCNITNQTMIVSDNWPAVTWYMNIYAQRGVLNVKNQSHYWLFSKEILSQNETHHAATYYIDTNNPIKADYPGLSKIYERGDVVIYENNYILNNKNATVESDEYINYIDSYLESVKANYGDVNGKLYP
ncbi:MAG: glycosyltransferase family 39 protein [Methanosphaera sp.]|nr:glycosyltransferase family 39 protein [Methanosphaera sp.]